MDWSPEWTEELTNAFRRFLNSDDKEVVNAAIFLIGIWRGRDRFRENIQNELGQLDERGKVFHLTESALASGKATLNNAEASNAWTDEVPGGPSADELKRLRLDGKVDVVALSNLGFSGDTSITVSGWFKVHPDAGERNNLFGFGNAGNQNRVFSVRTKGDGSWLLYFWSNDLDASTSTYYGKWTHVAAVYNASLDRHAIYVNGRKVAEDAPSDPDFTDRNYRIGGFTNEHFRGLIHDLRIYDRTLSSNKIQHLIR